MAHDWERVTDPADKDGLGYRFDERVRRCYRCHASQKAEPVRGAFNRITSYRWRPLWGRCEGD
jgi:hypothetical protein